MSVARVEMRHLAGLLAAAALAWGIAPVAASGPATGWELETGVDVPSYAIIDPATTDLNIDSVVLSCEQGASRRGLQLRLYLSSAGPLAPRGAHELKNDPAVEVTIDGATFAAELFFAEDVVVVADTAAGTMPLLSEGLLDAMQAGRRMELHFDLAKEADDAAAVFESSATVDLQAGRGGAAVAILRRCGDGTNMRSAARLPAPAR